MCYKHWLKVYTCNRRRKRYIDHSFVSIVLTQKTNNWTYKVRDLHVNKSSHYSRLPDNLRSTQIPHRSTKKHLLFDRYEYSATFPFLLTEKKILHKNCIMMYRGIYTPTWIIKNCYKLIHLSACIPSDENEKPHFEFFFGNL